jgi:hypothetical protein
MKKIPPKKLKLHILGGTPLLEKEGLGEVFLELVFYFLRVALKDLCVSTSVGILFYKALNNTYIMI